MNKQKFNLIKVLLTLLSLVLAIVFKSDIDWTVLGNNIFDYAIFCDIVYDLSIGVFSAMIIVWFVDEISDRIRERQSRDEEREAIVRSNKLLELYIKQYEAMFYLVVTPMSERKVENINMPKDICLKDMCELHRSSLVMSHAIGVSAIRAFFDIELQLREEFGKQLERHRFNYYDSIKEQFIDFISISIKFDCRSAILDYENCRLGDKDMKQFIEDTLRESGEKLVKDFVNGTMSSCNLFNNYVLLLIMMQEERECILKYKLLIESMGDK